MRPCFNHLIFGVCLVLYLYHIAYVSLIYFQFPVIPNEKSYDSNHFKVPSILICDQRVNNNKSPSLTCLMQDNLYRYHDCDKLAYFESEKLFFQHHACYQLKPTNESLRKGFWKGAERTYLFQFEIEHVSNLSFAISNLKNIDKNHLTQKWLDRHLVSLEMGVNSEASFRSHTYQYLPPPYSDYSNQLDDDSNFDELSIKLCNEALFVSNVFVNPKVREIDNRNGTITGLVILYPYMPDFVFEQVIQMDFNSFLLYLSTIQGESDNE